MFTERYGQEHDSELDRETKLNNVLWKIIALLGLFIILLGVGYLNLRESMITTIKMPPLQNSSVAPKNIVIGINKANVSFYELWGRYLVPVIANINFENLENLNVVVNEMRPSKAIPKIREVDEFKQTIINNRISQEFTPIEYKAEILSEGTKGIITCSGISRKEVAGKKLQDKECTYKITFEFMEGVVYVEDFGTDCFN